MSDHDIKASFSWNERVSSVFNHLLVGVMMVCFAVVVTQFTKRLMPILGLDYLPLICFVVAMDAQYTKRVAKKYTLLSREWALFRIGEIIILIVGLRMFVSLQSGPESLWRDIQVWNNNFYDHFFSAEFIPIVLFVFVVWMISGSLAENIFDLEGDLLRMNNDPGPGMGEERYVARKQLMDHILLYGMVLVFITGLIRIDIRGVEGVSPPVTGVIGVVMYFVFGLTLLSQTQFAILRGGWSRARIPLSMKISSRWLLYSFAFLILLAALSILLPTSYSLGFLTTIGYVLYIVFDVVTKLFGFAILLLFWLLSRFGTQQDEPITPQTPPSFPEFDPAPITDGVAPWWDLLKSIIFWVAFLSVVGFSMYQYLKQHKGIVDQFRKIPGLIWVNRLVDWLMNLWKNVNTTINSTIEAGLNRIPSLTRSNSIREQWRYINLNKLSPRERILIFYLMLTHRGSESGIRRKKSQTPNEYANILKSQLPDVDEEISSMTNSFIEARYSQHNLSENRAHLVRNLWRRIRTSLRKKK
jgi:hypothetical protein